jgi:hypothetical protein
MVRTFREIGKIKLKGRIFTSGGAWVGKRKDTGKHEALLYAYEKEGKIGDWKGKWKVPAVFGNEWTGNMGDKRQHITTMIDGKKFSGTYFKDAGDIVRLKEVM